MQYIKSEDYAYPRAQDNEWREWNLAFHCKLFSPHEKETNCRAYPESDDNGGETLGRTK